MGNPYRAGVEAARDNLQSPGLRILGELAEWERGRAGWGEGGPFFNVLVIRLNRNSKIRIHKFRGVMRREILPWLLASSV